MSMSKIPSRLFHLAKKWLKGTITEEEKSEFDTWYNSFDDTYYELNTDETELAMEHRMQDSILKAIDKESVISSRFIWYKVVAAAVVLITLSSILFVYVDQEPKNKALAKNQVKDHIVPGGNKAILTLANGKKISLTDASNGQIASQSGIKITKTKDGQLIYTVNADASASKNANVYATNTIETPRGGQYQLLLPDGTKVWLNAESSLTFPTTFEGRDERAVSLTGEGYFEVAKDKSKPFKVFALPFPRPSTLRNQIVEVYGTHFNINAYANEPVVKTTLLEGSVSVNYKYKLTPGNQSIFDGKSIKIVPADTDVETAWKNGDFVFDGQDLQTILRMVSRWYNVDFVYNAQAGNPHFGGIVSRSKDISAVIKMMESTGDVKFKIEGRRIIMIK